MAQSLYDEFTELVNDVKELSNRLTKIWNKTDHNLSISNYKPSTHLICDSCKEKKDGIYLPKRNRSCQKTLRR